MTTYNKIEIENKLINEYKLVIDDMSFFFTDGKWDELLEDLDDIGEKISKYTFYRQYYCENFFTHHPNKNSICVKKPINCKVDKMGSHKDMRIRLTELIKTIEPRTNELKEPQWLLTKDYNPDAKIIKCVCGHNIKSYNFVLHIPTGISLLLGSECIEYVEENLNGQFKCKVCKKLKNCEDRRKVPFSKKCCSMKCYEIFKEEKRRRTEFNKNLKYELQDIIQLKKQEQQRQRQRLRERREKQEEKEIKLTNYRLTFGKYEGQILKDTNPSYIDWVYRNVKLKKYKNLKEAIEYNFDVIEEYEYY